ncbi:hypothetical protein D3C83_133010 [compost metagenome]
MQKRSAVIRIAAPRVLAVQDDGEHAIFAVVEPIEESGLDRAEEVLDRHLRIGVLSVPKSDSIGQISVPEEQRYCGSVVR